VSRAILGSVAEAVIRTAPCPILTVPAAAPAPGPAPEAEVLAPRHCVVCALETEAEQLICQRCRARIRGEAPERKAHAERPGRRGTPL
jgi:hypothetical protein